MSNNNYLKRFRNFLNVSVKADHPVIEKNKFYVLSRFVMKCNSNSCEYTSVRVTMKYGDKFAKKFVDLYVHRNRNQEKIKIGFGEIVKLENVSDVNDGMSVVNTYYVRNDFFKNF
jgi:hypothetical protein